MSTQERYKDTKLGRIPSEWEVVQLGQIFRFSGGVAVSRAGLGAEGIKYLHYGDIHKRNQLTFDTIGDNEWIPRVAPDTVPIKEEALLSTGDVVFADASEDYEGIGKSVVIENRTEEKFLSGLHTIIAKSNSSQVDFNYRKYMLLPEKVRKQFVYYATGATVYGISKENLAKISFALPPLPEQQKIADILSTVDEHIGETEELIDSTKTLKQGMMQRLLTKGIGHTEFKDTEIGRIPTEWNVFQTEQLLLSRKGSLKIGPFGSQLKKEYLSKSGPYRVYGQENVFQNDFSIGSRYLSDDMYEKLKSCALHEGDIVISMMGTIGKCAVVPLDFHPGIMDSHLIRLQIDTSKVNADFLKFLIGESATILNQIKSLAVGGIMDGLSSGIIKRLKFPIPQISEQRQIARMLTAIDDQTDANRSKLDALNRLKSGLMQQLLTGRIRVKV